MAMVLGLTSIVLLGSMLANAFATASDYYYDSVNVSVDGVQGATAYMYLRTVGGGTFYTRQGDFSISETNDANGYITLQSLTASGSSGQTTISDFTTDGFKRLIYADALYIGNVAGPNDPLMIAVYNVDKDTPAGDYTVSLSNVSMVGGTSGYGGEQLPDMTATIHVTRSDEPEPLPSQVVTFRDSEGNPITEISKYYGDADFTITKEVTTGDGAITEYHPDDDGTGSIAHTYPVGDYVGVGIPGDVEICAWVEETENYAATKACYTVHVLKRQISITGVTIADKSYDGMQNGTATSVSFSNQTEHATLSSSDYVTDTAFEDENAGENKSVTVTVTLINDAVDHYELTSNVFNTTKTITPYVLTAGNVTLVNGSTYTYEPDGVNPTVQVTANTHGGVSTLGSGDYDVSYSNNNAVGTGHVSITGKGNFTTGENPVVIDFTIEAKGINNGNLEMPSTIVQGRLLTEDDVKIKVDGHYLNRCTSPSDTTCDYTVDISGNNDGLIGSEIHVGVTARGNYTGVATGDVVVVAKEEQTVTIGSVTNTTVNATYGDTGIAYTASTTGDGTISYASGTESVATVDANGAITIVGVGDAVITATASETATYASASASYTLHVSKKTISLTGATVESRDYDGTTDAVVTNVTVSDSSLVYLTDFRVSDANFPSANMGSYEDVAVGVVLDISITDRYQFDTALETKAYINATASISAFALSSSNTSVVLSDTSFGYTGEAKEPTATVTVDLDGDGTKETTLTAGSDYTLSYNNNTNAGTATVQVNGIGNYALSISGIEFTITPAVVTDVAATAPSQTYTGSALTPVITVTGTVNGASKTFTTDDYQVAAHVAFIDAGDYTFAIGPKDGSNYNIPATNGTFTIEQAESGDPDEKTAGLSGLVGSTLADLGERSEGFTWSSPTTVITAGRNEYLATYTKNGDTTNYTTIIVSVPVIGYTAPYEVTKGDGQEYIIDGEEPLLFEISANFEIFEAGSEVYVDNVLVDPENYTATSGSTVIEFKKEFSDGLAVGAHKLGVLFSDGGLAKADFTVANPAEPDEPGAADTGVFTGVAGGAVATGFTALILVAIAGVVYKSTKKEA
ncbi:hypothetical protein IKF12_00370 [Candidatus Saccharibacteria bacterium]|nr:hypothetical protein [Candidatus Saccharibacteria bacterium]